MCMLCTPCMLWHVHPRHGGHVHVHPRLGGRSARRYASATLRHPPTWQVTAMQAMAPQLRERLLRRMVREGQVVPGQSGVLADYAAALGVQALTPRGDSSAKAKADGKTKAARDDMANKAMQRRLAALHSSAAGDASTRYSDESSSYSYSSCSDEDEDDEDDAEAPEGRPAELASQTSARRGARGSDGGGGGKKGWFGSLFTGPPRASSQDGARPESAHDPSAMPKEGNPEKKRRRRRRRRHVSRRPRALPVGTCMCMCMCTACACECAPCPKAACPARTTAWLESRPRHELARAQQLCARAACHVAGAGRLVWAAGRTDRHPCCSRALVHVPTLLETRGCQGRGRGAESDLLAEERRVAQAMGGQVRRVQGHTCGAAAAAAAPCLDQRGQAAKYGRRGQAGGAHRGPSLFCGYGERRQGCPGAAAAHG